MQNSSTDAASGNSVAISNKSTGDAIRRGTAYSNCNWKAGTGSYFQWNNNNGFSADMAGNCPEAWIIGPGRGTDRNQPNRARPHGWLADNAAGLRRRLHGDA